MLLATLLVVLLLSLTSSKYALNQENICLFGEPMTTASATSCSPCYHGTGCSHSYNNPPAFWTSICKITTDVDSFLRKITKLEATDVDICKARGNMSLGDCQEINYAIVPPANSPELLQILPNGEIYFKSATALESWRTMTSYNFTVFAYNSGIFVNDFAKIQVVMEKGTPASVVDIQPQPLKAQFLTVSPAKVDAIPPTYGVSLIFQLCLSSGSIDDAILRIRGFQRAGKYLSGGEIHIVGISSADHNIERSLESMNAHTINETEVEIIIGGLYVVSPTNSTTCSHLNIEGIIIAPPIDSETSPFESFIEVESIIQRIIVSAVTIPITIDSSLIPQIPDVFLEDQSEQQTLTPGTINCICIGVRTVESGTYQLTIYVHDPNLLVDIYEIAAPRGLTVKNQIYKHAQGLSIELYAGKNYYALIPDYPTSTSSIRVYYSLDVPPQSGVVYKLDASLRKDNKDIEHISLQFNATKWLIVEKHYPKQAYVHPFSVQILRVLISLPEGKDLNVTLKVESEAFYLYACPTRVKFHSSDGVTIKSGSVPELVLGYKMATIKQDGLASSSGNGSIEWILYLSFPKGFSSMHFVFDAQVGNYKTTQAFELANDNALPSTPPKVDLSFHSINCDQLNQNVLTCSYEFGPVAGLLQNVTMTCALVGSNYAVFHPNSRTYSNLAYPNPYSAENSCSPYLWRMGDILATENGHASNLIAMELNIPVYGSANQTLSIMCGTHFNRKWENISKDVTVKPSDKPKEETPYDLTLKVVEVTSGDLVSRQLQPGEVALVLFEFKQPAKSIANYVPTLAFEDDCFGVTFDCPYIVSVGKSIYWNENNENCIHSTATEYPINEYAYNIGPTICEDDIENKIIVASYIRVRTVPFPLLNSAVIVGTVGNEKVKETITLIDTSPVKLGLETIESEVWFQNLEEIRILLSSGEEFMIDCLFCMKPGIYIGNLRFEAFSESPAGNEEVITIKHIHFYKSPNFPGMQFPQSQILANVRKATGQIYSMATTAGPAFNTGASYRMKNRRPMLADDCINLGVKIQLTDGDGVNVNFSYPVVIQALNGDRVIHSSKANIIVTKQPLPYLGVSFRLFNAKRIATSAYDLDAEFSITTDSTLECHDASMWLLHGGLFSVEVLKVEISGVSVISGPISGNGMQIFEHGGIYFGSRGSISLSLIQLKPFKVNKNKVVAVSGLLLCKSYDRSRGLPNPPLGSSTYFGHHVALPIEVTDPVADPPYITLQRCQVRGDSTASYLLFETAPDAFWKAYIDSSVDILFGQKTTVERITFQLKSQDNKPMLIRILSTNDGKSFLFKSQATLTFPVGEIEESIDLDNMIKIRGLRITIKKALFEHEFISIKMGFFGTSDPKADGDFDPCEPVTSNNAGSQCEIPLAERGYIAGRDFVVFCDRIPSTHEDTRPYSACFRAYDKSPTVWKYLGPKITNVNFYIAPLNLIIGASCCGNYLMSNDSGDSWVYINYDYVTYLTSHYEVAPVISIPFKRIPQSFEPTFVGSQCTLFTLRNWHLCYDGIYYEEKMVFTWNYH